jgi:hypothetical protein
MKRRDLCSRRYGVKYRKTNFHNRRLGNLNVSILRPVFVCQTFQLVQIVGNDCLGRHNNSSAHFWRQFHGFGRYGNIRIVCGRQSCRSTDCHMLIAESVTFSCVYVKMQGKVCTPNCTVRTKCRISRQRNVMRISRWAFVRCLRCAGCARRFGS